MSDEKWTERPVAIMVPGPDESISEKNLIEHLQQFLILGKIEYHFVSELPKTSAGKIDKKKIKAMPWGPNKT